MILPRNALRAALACLVLASAPAHAETVGRVSFYGTESGTRTANGERFNPWGDTCASWSLPFNTRVRVTDIQTGRAVVCRVNDRGPHPRLRRAIDLSHGLARRLGIERRGVITARVHVLD